MVTDPRSRKLVLVAHGILNQNAISDGAADHPGMDKAVVAACWQREWAWASCPARS